MLLGWILGLPTFHATPKLQPLRIHQLSLVLYLSPPVDEKTSYDSREHGSTKRKQHIRWLHPVHPNDDSLQTYFPGHKPLGITNQQECHEDAHHGQPSVAQLLHQIDQSWPTSHAGRSKFGLESLWVQTSFRCWSSHTFKTQPGLVSLIVYIYTNNIRGYIRM